MAMASIGIELELGDDELSEEDIVLDDGEGKLGEGFCIEAEECKEKSGIL